MPFFIHSLRVRAAEEKQKGIIPLRGKASTHCKQQYIKEKASIVFTSVLLSAFAELGFLGFISPRRRLYPPACKPYGLEAGPEAGNREKINPIDPVNPV